MPHLELKQLQFENDTWKRLLGFMMDENIRLKNRLTEVLKDSFDHNLLEELECFQNKFIKEDELIRLMRHEAVEIDQLLAGDKFEKEELKMKLVMKLNHLRNNIVDAEMQFGTLKICFNHYLSENLQYR